MDCEFSRSVHVVLAFKPAHLQSMRQKAAWYQKELGYSVEIIGPDELYREIGSRAKHDGVVDETSAGLNRAEFPDFPCGKLHNRHRTFARRVAEGNQPK